jgi:hypothetical protein
MFASRRPRSYPGDAFLGSTERNEYQMDPIAVRLSFSHEFQGSPSGERRFHRKAYFVGQVVWVSVSTDLAAEIAASPGFGALILRPTASGSRRFPRPSKSIRFVKVDLPDPLGPAITVRTGTRSGRADSQLTNNLVVASRRRARNPGDFESSPVRQFHYFQAVGIEIENRLAIRKRLLKSAVPRRISSPVEVFTGKVICRGHDLIINPWK